MIPSSMNNFCVYFHYRLSDNKLFYIGYGDERRPFDFRNRGKVWKRVSNKHGVRVEIIRSKLTKDDACKLEIELIKIHKPFCNFSPGGCGGNTWSSLSKDRQEEIRLKLRKSQSGKNHSQYGKPKSESSRLKMMESKIKLGLNKPFRCIQTNEIFRTSGEASRKLKIGAYYIIRVLHKKRPTAYGYSFEYL